MVCRVYDSSSPLSGTKRRNFLVYSRSIQRNSHESLFRSGFRRMERSDVIRCGAAEMEFDRIIGVDCHLLTHPCASAFAVGAILAAEGWRCRRSDRRFGLHEVDDGCCNSAIATGFWSGGLTGCFLSPHHACTRTNRSSHRQRSCSDEEAFCERPVSSSAKLGVQGPRTCRHCPRSNVLLLDVCFEESFRQLLRRNKQ